MSRLCLLLLLLALPFAATAQTADHDGHAAIERAVQQLFDGMRAGDSTAVRAVVHPDARFATAMMRGTTPVVETGDPERFIAAVGTPHDQVWDERIANLRIEMDGPLASAWMDYAFYLGDQFSHCGVNAIQFVYDGEAWRIYNLIDTRRRDTCAPELSQ